MLSLKPMQRDLVAAGHRAEEFLDRHLQPRHRRRHAAADVDGHDEFERHVLGAEVRNLLRLAVFLDLESRPRQPRHEVAGVVGHRRDDLDDVDVHFFRVAERLGAHRPHDASAARQLGDHSDLLRDDGAAGFPGALERLGGRLADLASVHVEQDAAGRGRRRQVRAKQSSRRSGRRRRWGRRSRARARRWSASARAAARRRRTPRGDELALRRIRDVHALTCRTCRAAAGHRPSPPRRSPRSARPPMACAARDSVSQSLPSVGFTLSTKSCMAAASTDLASTARQVQIMQYDRDAEGQIRNERGGQADLRQPPPRLPPAGRRQLGAQAAPRPQGVRAPRLERGGRPAAEHEQLGHREQRGDASRVRG